MGKFFKLNSLLLIGIFTISVITSSAKVDNFIEDDKVINIELIEEEGVEATGYLPLQQDRYADDAKKIEIAISKWDFKIYNSNKVAYLTFDDGPSTYITEKILDVLKINDVKATFFVLGSMIDKDIESKELFKRIVYEQHAIGNHGYSHKYERLYPNGEVDVGAFMMDMNKSLASMQAILGRGFYTRLIRFPGGHSAWNTKEIDKYLQDNNYVFIDWNIITGDAEAVDRTKQQLLEKLKSTIEELGENNDVIVVLMHDTDILTENPEVVQEAIVYLRELGYEFRTLK